LNQKSAEPILGSKSITWWQVARRPKWLANLVLALAVAAIFAALGQWQLSRTLVSAPTPSPSDSNAGKSAVELTSLATPNTILPVSAYDRLVKFDASCDSKQIFIVANRVQLLASGAGQTGYWLLRKCLLNDGVAVTVAEQWAASLEQAESIRTAFLSESNAPSVTLRTGILEPSEPIFQSKDLGEVAKGRPYLLGSVSSAQLLNLFAPDGPIVMYDGVVLAQDLPSSALGQPIRIGTNNQHPLDINWLNAFYAAEWALFAGFAIFLWWRLVEDERQREKAEGLN
jgi:surfeit locus 1 family protein